MNTCKIYHFLLETNKENNIPLANFHEEDEIIENEEIEEYLDSRYIALDPEENDIDINNDIPCTSPHLQPLQNSVSDDSNDQSNIYIVLYIKKFLKIKYVISTLI